MTYYIPPADCNDNCEMIDNKNGKEQFPVYSMIKYGMILINHFSQAWDITLSMAGGHYLSVLFKVNIWSVNRK